MMEFSARYRGTAAATGMVEMNPDPDYTRGKGGFQAWLGITAAQRIALQVDALDGAVELQGNNGNPTVEDEWYTIEELTADGRVIVNEDPIDFVRVNCTTLTSGTPLCLLTIES